MCLLDRDPERRYDEYSREVINDLLEGKCGVPLDPVVTPDRRRLARVPYSLHAGVCRAAQLIDDPGFDPRTEAVPDVLSGGVDARA